MLYYLQAVLETIDQEKYFVFHAPRQTGKTTCLLALADYLNRAGDYRAVYANIETAQAAREDVAMGMADVSWKIALAASQQLGDATALPLVQEVRAVTPATTLVQTFLARWCEDAALPTVLLLDEVDALVGDALIAQLRQLCSGYANRPQRFPQTIILCGVRDLQDYRIHASSEKTAITGGSAFNIKAKSLRLGDFNKDEAEGLLLEHTTETGQVFTPEALELIWELTRGQPWPTKLPGAIRRVATAASRSLRRASRMRKRG